MYKKEKKTKSPQKEHISQEIFPLFQEVEEIGENQIVIFATKHNVIVYNKEEL